MTKYITEEVTDKDTLEFADFILPNEEVFLAGGAFKKLFHVNDAGTLVGPSVDELVGLYNKDYDLFSRSKEAFDSVQKQFEAEELVKRENDLGNDPSYGNSVGYERIKNYRVYYVDLVHKYFGTPEEIMDQFDFTVTQCAMYKKGGKIYLTYSNNFKHDLVNRVLAYASTPDRSENVAKRLTRYMNYGFAPTEDTLNRGLRAIMDSSEILKNVAVADVLKPEFLKQVKAISEISVLLNRNRYVF